MKKHEEEILLKAIDIIPYFLHLINKSSSCLPHIVMPFNVNDYFCEIEFSRNKQKFTEIAYSKGVYGNRKKIDLLL